MRTGPATGHASQTSGVNMETNLKQKGNQHAYQSEKESNLF